MDLLPPLTSFAVPATLMLVLSLLLVRRRQRAQTRRQEANDAIDTVIGWQPEAARVLTITEPMAVQVTPRRVAVGAQTPGRVVVDPGALALSPAAVRVETTGGRWSEPMAAGDDGRWRGTLVPPSERSTTALSVTIGELTLRVRPKIFVR